MRYFSLVALIFLLSACSYVENLRKPSAQPNSLAPPSQPGTRSGTPPQSITVTSMPITSRETPEKTEKSSLRLRSQPDDSYSLSAPSYLLPDLYLEPSPKKQNLFFHSLVNNSSDDLFSSLSLNNNLINKAAEQPESQTQDPVSRSFEEYGFITPRNELAQKFTLITSFKYLYC